jgi:hypothetical protein
MLNLQGVGVVVIGIEGAIRGREGCKAKGKGTPGKPNERRAGEGQKTAMVTPVV